MMLLPPQILGFPSLDVVSFLALFLLLLCAVSWLLSRKRLKNLKQQYQEGILALEARREQDFARLDELQIQLSSVEKEAQQLLSEKLSLDQSVRQMQLQQVKYEQQALFNEQRLESLAAKEERLISVQSELSSAKTKLSEQRDHHEAQLQFIEQSRQQMLNQFEGLSRKIYEQQAKRFTDDSNQTLSQLLSPLKTQLNDFKTKVESSHEKESAERHMLAGKISELQKQTQQIGSDAINLARALKGESKTQGNWGEVILERLLEESGLQKGREYETQMSLETADGDKRYPDVVIRLPQDKDIVVDSKVSLRDYEQHCSSDEPAEKAAALRRHVQAIRNHVSGLSLKEYEKLEGIRSLDFVFLFVPVEAAFMAALQADDRLFQDAYNKHIVLVSPTTLLASLRTVENLWRHEKQHKNAQKIADQAGGLHDQFMLMLQSLDDLGKQIDKTQTAYEITRKRLSSGRGNLLKRSLDIQKLGAKTKKTMPEAFVEELESSAEHASLSLVGEKNTEGSLDQNDLDEQAVTD